MCTQSLLCPQSTRILIYSLRFLTSSSYVEDPKWQIKFTAIWASCVGAAVLVSLPHLARALRSRRAFTGLFGVWDDWSYQSLPTLGGRNTEKKVERSGRRLAGVLRTVASVLLWTPMGTGLDLGQSKPNYLCLASPSRSNHMCLLFLFVCSYPCCCLYYCCHRLRRYKCSSHRQP